MGQPQQHNYIAQPSRNFILHLIVYSKKKCYALQVVASARIQGVEETPLLGGWGVASR